ncbi:MAG: hypothetical protein GX803_08240 [Lentisphaerae bacterium]|nr:hypothetical protein [Lentisphaerota bacterium]
MHELAYAIAEIYDWRSPPGSHGKKEHLRHTGPVEMLFLANHLYALDSFEVAGNVLECGASHGYSTCVLSHACAQLKRKLFVADSFEGLPPTRKDQGFFVQGDYAASLESVSDNLTTLGRLDAVDFIKGFYADSLKGFRHPLCLLWLDVDLYESAQDVLSNVFHCLNPAGIIATHEFTDFHNHPYSIDEKCPPSAIFKMFESSGLNYRTIHLMRYFGMIAGDNSIQPDSGAFLPFLLNKLDTMDHRSRQFQELRQSNTVRTAFRIKNLLMPRQTRPSAPEEASAVDAMSAAELEIKKNNHL